MQFEKIERFICTGCGFMTTNKPDCTGEVECKACVNGMSHEEYDEFCKQIDVGNAR
jgi:hypothetical protein